MKPGGFVKLMILLFFSKLIYSFKCARSEESVQKKSGKRIRLPRLRCALYTYIVYGDSYAETKCNARLR